MGEDGDVQEHYDLSLKYLEAAKNNLDNDLYEPALFSGIHALELAIKALLMLKVDGPILTHNVGGLFGKHYREEFGEDLCKRINRDLIGYNLPRYPGVEEYDADEVEGTIEFIEQVITQNIKKKLEADVK